MLPIVLMRFLFTFFISNAFRPTTWPLFELSSSSARKTFAMYITPSALNPQHPSLLLTQLFSSFFFSFFFSIVGPNLKSGEWWLMATLLAYADSYTAEGAGGPIQWGAKKILQIQQGSRLSCRRYTQITLLPPWLFITTSGHHHHKRVLYQYHIFNQSKSHTYAVITSQLYISPSNNQHP